LVRGLASRARQSKSRPNNGCALRSQKHLDETAGVIASRRFSLRRAVGDEGDISICWCNAAGPGFSREPKAQVAQEAGLAHPNCW
jgi:hypothetical protein